MNVPLIVAHRAMTPGAIENAPSAVIQAAAHGADLIELDVRLSLDRRPVLLHDAMLRRTTRGRGWVRLWPARALDRLRIADSDGERITRLETVLRDLPEGVQPALHLKDRAALRQVLRLVRRFGLAHRTWLWLEHAQDVYTATRTLPELRVTLLRPSGWRPVTYERYVREAQWVGAAGISLPAGVIDASHLVMARQHHLRVFSRVDSPSEGVDLAKLGVGGLITDDPAAVRRLVEQAT